MNFYAFNTTPINGWEAHLGRGQAALTMLANGKSANVVLGSGAALLSISASGEGTRRAPSFGEASMLLQAEGEGTRRVLGSGLAPMQLTADGDGNAVDGAGGRISMALRAQGLGGFLVYGDGVSQLRLSAEGEGRVAKTHFGSAHAIMEFRARDIPKRYSTHHGQGHAEVRLAAAGYGTVIAKNSGAAYIQLQAQGRVRIGARIIGYGKASMSLIALRVESSQHRQIYGSGSASMAFTADARDNRVLMLPSAFSPAPRARELRVAAENRAMHVPRTAAKQLSEA